MEQRQDKKNKSDIRILLVDDEEFLANMWRMSLERRGYQVTVFTKSMEALGAFEENPKAFDIVITDQTMPGMTGVTLASRLMEYRADIPIVLCTGYSEFVNEEIVKELGIRAFIMKPFDINQLEEVISKLLFSQENG